jgi:HK97 family phage major capsid protein
MAGVFDRMITRADAADLIPDEYATQILAAVPEVSAALTVLRRVNMGTKVFRQPVLSSLAEAYWVNGDTGLKQTTSAAWEGIDLVAEEIAAIVPVPDSVIADASVPIWNEVRPLLAAEIGRKLDMAVFSGIDKPPTWPEAIIPASVAAGAVVTADSAPADGGIANDLDNAMSVVEASGFDVSGFAAKRQVRGRMRAARDTTGQKLIDLSSGQFEGQPIAWVGAGVFDESSLVVAGDFSMAVLGVRQDLTWKLLDQAVLTDETGKILLNLPQQDSTALRVVARFAFAVGIPVTHREAGATGEPFPFAVLRA